MLRRIPRLVRGAVVLIALVAVSATVYQSWAAGQPGMGGWVQTQWGPVGPADRDLLVRVRQAGLWEGPTGQQAQQMASSPQVRDVGGKLATEHAQLDEEVRKVANQLGVVLPSSPSSQQVAWMNEISSKTGADYDRTFVQLVREAHGQVLPIISDVRANTRNDLVRQFAITSAEYVNRHHLYLESTGLVNYAELPHHSPGLLAGGTAFQDLIVPIVVFVAALLAAIALLWGLRNRSSGRRERVTLPPPGPQLADLAAVAAIPAPRPGVHGGFDDTGPIPLITDAEERLIGTRAGRSTTDRASSGTGPHRAVPETGSRRTASRVSDSGSQRSVSDSGRSRAVTDTGSQGDITDSGPLRAVTGSGSHRLPRRSRSRHSIRR
jgi:predicted outer membrane protein